MGIKEDKAAAKAAADALATASTDEDKATASAALETANAAIAADEASGETDDSLIDPASKSSEGEVVHIETIALHPSHGMLDTIEGKLNVWRISADAEIRELLQKLRETLP